MKRIIQLVIDDQLTLNLCEIDIPNDEAQNVCDALDCELWYNDFEMDIIKGD